MILTCLVSLSEMGSNVDADLPDVSISLILMMISRKMLPPFSTLTLWFCCLLLQPPQPSLPEEETDEERGLRRLFEQLAGAVTSKTLKFLI